jgi:hypothetical protein
MERGKWRRHAPRIGAQPHRIKSMDYRAEKIYYPPADPSLGKCLLMGMINTGLSVNWTTC